MKYCPQCKRSRTEDNFTGEERRCNFCRRGDAKASETYLRVRTDIEAATTWKALIGALSGITGVTAEGEALYKLYARKVERWRPFESVYPDA